MKNLIALLAASFLMPFSMFGQGVLTPPGGPSPTMKTLSQIEPRTPISSLPFFITSPGAYYLTTNLVATMVNSSIVIGTNGVTLDLNGFTISSSFSGNAGAAIVLFSGNDVTILNGHIEGGVTNNGSNFYGGPGFYYGIYASASVPLQNIRISGVSVSGVLDHGIYLLTGNATMVEDCQVHTAGNYGIIASVVKSCTTLDCGTGGIDADQVSDCRCQATGSGANGIFANDIVQNSYGYATNNGSGIVCDGTVLNSRGYGGGSYQSGIYAWNVANCYGYDVATGYGVLTTMAENSYGSSANGTGLNARVAQNCYGISVLGTGVSAYIATGCYGSTTSGAAFNVTHNVNSF